MSIKWRISYLRNLHSDIFSSFMTQLKILTHQHGLSSLPRRGTQPSQSNHEVKGDSGHRDSLVSSSTACRSTQEFVFCDKILHTINDKQCKLQNFCRECQVCNKQNHCSNVVSGLGPTLVLTQLVPCSWLLVLVAMCQSAVDR